MEVRLQMIVLNGVKISITKNYMCGFGLFKYHGVYKPLESTQANPSRLAVGTHGAKVRA